MIQFFSHCFYLIGILGVWYEMTHIFNSYNDYIQRVAWNKKIKTVFNDRKPGEKLRDEQQMGCLFVFLHLGYMFWSFLGFFTSQQHTTFGFFILIGLIVSSIKILFGGKIISFIWDKFDSIISFALLCFLILNHFMQLFDLDSYLRQWIFAR